MSSRNREENSVVSGQLSVVSRNRRRTTDYGRRTKSARRGVLLLVVLSLLVLFMLIGTAYLMSSSQYAKGAKDSGKLNRVGSPPTKQLDSALMQILRDTGEPSSVVRYHSLLRDLYGSDGFEAQIYSPATRDLNTRPGQVTRFAGGIVGTPQENMGPTQGQLVDLYVKVLTFGQDDPDTTGIGNNESTLPAPDSRHGIKLDRDPNGQPQAHEFPLTKGYYNGCLLTITSGPASGQSTRVIDYEFLGNISPSSPTATLVRTRLFRFRVMAFPRADGTPLNVDQSAAREPELTDLANARFIINGRPFNGTGVGYNPMAAAGTPRLNAVERNAIDTSNPLYSEVALTPNSVHVLLSDATASSTDDYGVGFLVNPTTFQSLNPKAVAPAQRATQWKYPSFVGTGDTDESYDAADYQNMALALQTVLPRPRGRVVQGNAANPTYHEADFQNDVAGQAAFTNAGQFLRLDLEDLPLPSFHRPDLINFWFHRLARFAADPTVPLSVLPGVAFDNDDVRAVLQPYGPDGIRDNADDPGVDLAIRDQIVAIKRRISLRPIREDHPNFDGSNPQSRPSTFTSGQVFQVNGTHIAVPFWEAVGPWDVDNDNDGVPDSVWVDLGDPVVQAEDGTLYKPLYAFLILDMDSRLNVNAHGLVEHLRSPSLDSTINPITDVGPGNLAHDLSAGGLNTSNYMSPGIGYGPAEISLRPVLSRNLPGSALSANVGNPVPDQDADDYARLLVGRPPSTASQPIWGRHGLMTLRGAATDVRPGIPYRYVGTPAQQAATIDQLPFMKFFGHPWWPSNYYGATPAASSFGNPPDLMGRYALGLDYAGQPVVEANADHLRWTGGLQTYETPLLFDSPYELNLSDSTRRDTPDSSMAVTIHATPAAAVNDDAPFATADLERLLRSFDADSGLLPDRLWNLVDAFDPLKLRDNQPAAVQAMAVELFGTSSGPQQLAAAQQMASINRRLVTTDSYDLPVPSQNMPGWASAFGPDGAPGIAGVDDDGNGTVDDPTEIGWRTATETSDDFEAITGQQYSRATIVNLLHYRVFLDQRRKQIQLQSWTEPLTGAQNQIVKNLADAIMNGNAATGIPPLAEQLLAPEVIAGKRMDLNRPFGDGQDNAGNGRDDNGDGLVDEAGEAGDPFDLANGIVDDPLEAGEPFLDVNGNGRWDTGEPFIDMLKDDAGGRTGEYDGPRDQLWQGLANEPITFDYTNGMGVPIHPDTATGGIPASATVRNLDSQGRQLYARQLYCLMMLLVEEGYVELPDMPTLGGDNVNLEWFFEILGERRPTVSKEENQVLAARKLMARQIAQWAINCVDFRDADSIMTPFEYDENPWDGWGTRDGNGRLIPLDGDPGTNENGNDVTMIEADLETNNQVPAIDWEKVPVGPDGTANTDDDNSRVIKFVDGPGTVADQTRGVVWGAERPELLITETMAMHDRRATDEFEANSTPENYSIFNPPTNSNPGPEGPFPDYDLDQRLKPRGSLFVELYNPWSNDGQKPAEFYGTPNGAGAPQGVMLNRLTNYSTVQNGVPKFSPVWRLTVLRDPLNGRMMNSVIDVDASANDFDGYVSYILQSLSTDIDGYGIDSDFIAERYIYFTTGDGGGDSDRSDDNRIAVDATTPGEYVLQDLGGGVKELWPKMDHLKVRVPALPYRWDQHPTSLQDEPYPAARRYFIARTERTGLPEYKNDLDVPVAPILPGRYAVLGTAGLQLDQAGQPTQDLGPGMRRSAVVGDRFVLPISRWRFSGNSDDEQDDAQHLQQLPSTRRIELWPTTNPNLQQLLVGENGGKEFVRKGASFVNVTDPDGNGNPHNSLSGIVAPCIAIPVEEMNISEPTEGYPSLRYQNLYKTLGQLQTPVNIAKEQVNAQGEVVFDVIYDRPLDIEFELVRNGTTQNYRSLHLQRLANPTLPWNPPKYDAVGTENRLHHPNLPVNPYLTIDSQSVDLTAYNGASVFERSNLPTPEADNDTAMEVETTDTTQADFFAPLIAEELVHAPNHVLWAVARMFETEQIPAPRYSLGQIPEFREFIKIQPETVQGYLDQLEPKRGATNVELEERQKLLVNPRVDQYNRNWSGQWGWSLLRRVLPDDQWSDTEFTVGQFRQRFHLKSLERGARHQGYDLPPSSAPAGAVEGWKVDYRWLPRLLWKQELPNRTFFLKKGATGTTKKVTDLKNVKSHRVLKAANASPWSPADEVPPPIDEQMRDGQIKSQLLLEDQVVNFVMEHTLGFVNESYAPELDRIGGSDSAALLGSTDPMPGAPEIATTANAPALPGGDSLQSNGMPWPTSVTPGHELGYNTSPRNNPPNLSQLPVAITSAQELSRREFLMRSTFPWFAWNNRPYVSENELMQVPVWSSSLMLRNYSGANPFTLNPYDGNGVLDPPGNPPTPETAAEKLGHQQSPFGHILNFFATSNTPAKVTPSSGSTPLLLEGAPHYYRLLDFVHVPSRYVGTETLLSPEVFNDPGGGNNLVGAPINSPNDPRYKLQPPFNKVARERDPGRVNLNTVVGRRSIDASTGNPRSWSEVYDGIMHRYGDGNLLDTASGNPLQLSHVGPAWRDVILSRRGYPQRDALDNSVDKPVAVPDTFAFGLSAAFPTFFANPFRSSDTGDLVPLDSMVRMGVDATLLRSHHYARAQDTWLQAHPFSLVGETHGNIRWGVADVDDDNNGIVDDIREAGFGILNDTNIDGDVLYTAANGALGSSGIPLFSESLPEPSIDAERNPGMMYQPMTRLGNLVTTRSNVYAIWVTVGYFEVEPAPPWTDTQVQAKFGGDGTVGSAATVAARAMYDRVYPEGYALGQEVGIDIGNTKRQRAFYIIDRTEPVGFKPGEDLNVERMIRVRRRIE